MLRNKDRRQYVIISKGKSNCDRSDLCCFCRRFINQGDFFVRSISGKLAHYRCGKENGWRPKIKKKKRILPRPVEKIVEKPERRIKVIKGKLRRPPTKRERRDLLMGIPYVSAQLRRGTSRLGWTSWWLVDAQGNLLNTEPVCTTPEDKWHPWFITILQDLKVPYLGVKESLVPDQCIHCNPELAPSGSDGWCDCRCHQEQLGF